MSKYFFLNKILIGFSLLLLSACSAQDGTNNKTAEILPPTSLEFAKLSRALANYEIDAALAMSKNYLIEDLRTYFETQHNAGFKVPNYGILLDLGVITLENKAVFKPRIDHDEPFFGIPNTGSNCWFIAPIMALAALPEFDDFLELDKNEQLWAKRMPKSRAYAESVLRTLRHLVYEIRLGSKTSTGNIGKLRALHEQAFESMTQEVFVEIYHDLINLYQLDAFHDFDDEKNYALRKASTPKLSLEQIGDAIDKKRLMGADAITECLKKRSGGTASLYLLALLSIVDPFGQTARYLSIIRMKFKDDEPNKLNFTVLKNVNELPTSSVISLPMENNEVISLQFYLSEESRTTQAIKTHYDAKKNKVYMSLKTPKPIYRICNHYSCVGVTIIDSLAINNGKTVAMVKEGLSARNVRHVVTLSHRGKTWFRNDNDKPIETDQSKDNFSDDKRGNYTMQFQFIRHSY